MAKKIMTLNTLLIRGMIVCLIAIILILVIFVIANKYVFADETLSFPVYIMEKQNIYLQEEPVEDYNEYNRQQRELDREYRMSQELNEPPAPPTGLITVPTVD